MEVEDVGTNFPAFSQAHGVDLRTIELDVLSQDSVDAAVAKVIVDTGHIDALVHNAGHMVFGRPRPSRRSISPSYMTSTCSAPSPLDGSVSVSRSAEVAVRRLKPSPGLGRSG